MLRTVAWNRHGLANCSHVARQPLSRNFPGDLHRCAPAYWATRSDNFQRVCSLGFRSKGWGIFQSSIVVGKILDWKMGRRRRERSMLESEGNENSGEYFYLEKLKSSETFDISFARHSWKIVVVWKNFWNEGVEGSRRILERIDLKTSNPSNPLSAPPLTSSHATNPKPIHLLPERERKREHDPRESRNYKLRGQIHPRIDQPVPKEKERKKGGANEACPEKRASIQPARGRCPRTSRSRACVRGYNGSTGHGEVSGCCPNGWEAYIGGGPRIGHSVVRGLIGRGIRWIS